VLAAGSLVAGLTVVADQLTKAGANVLGNTAVTYPVTNPDFSLGLASGSLSMMVLVTLAGMVAFGAYVVWQAMGGRLAAWVPGLLLGGAASNLADRLLFGAVRDFLRTPWAVMNLADLAVLLGIAGYAWGHLRRREPTTDHVEEVNPT
jgi:signal peptidase II